MIFKELNRCVIAAVEKLFLWRMQNEVFPAIHRRIRISGKFACKPHEKHVFPTTLLRVRSP